MENKKLKATTTIRIPRFVNMLLWKFGANRRKKILKFFGLWTFEDELFEILSDEIRNEIDKEILATVKTNEN